MIGKSIAYPGDNCFSPAVPFGEMLVAINPICAEIIAEGMPDIDDVQKCLWRARAVSPPTGSRRSTASRSRRRAASARTAAVYLTPEPKDMLLFVCGGLGGLHASALHSFGSSLSQTREITTAVPA